MPNYRKKCQCCQKFFSFSGETKKAEITRFGLNVFKTHDGRPAGFYGALRESAIDNGKKFYSRDLNGTLIPHPCIDLEDEYYRLIRLKINKLWRQRLIFDEDIVLCPPEGVKAMMWHKKVSSVHIVNYPHIVYTPVNKSQGLGNYCYDCYRNSGTLAWTIWYRRMDDARMERNDKFIAANVIKEWWKKIYWSPDTKIGKKRFYQGLIKDGLMTKEDIDVEHWTDEQFLDDVPPPEKDDEAEKNYEVVLVWQGGVEQKDSPGFADYEKAKEYFHTLLRERKDRERLIAKGYIALAIKHNGKEIYWTPMVD